MTTGTWTGASPLQPGEHWAVGFSPLGLPLALHTSN
jgi:hypothetical protein